MFTKFEEIGLDEKILAAVKELGFESPMPIQEKVIPELLQNENQDIIALAQTGTGKTAAFGLPIVQNVNPKSKNVQYLILAPTRELCIQIADDLASFAKYKPDVKIAAVFGGASIEHQIKLVKKGAHIISATPGRLVDLINRKKIDISKIKTVVLDEADEMLDMGFKDELEAILNETPENKNTLLFSATMPSDVQKIANKYMNKPTEITVGKRNSGAENVNHICYMVHAKERYLALKRIADFNPDIYGIIFCRTRMETKEVADKLLADGYNAEALHGDLSQAQRDAVMNKFRNKHLNLLVATDVAARGIDVDDLSHIINYDLPDELELYIHRSGRTGRAGKNGTSIVIANMKEKYKIDQIEKKLNKKFTFLPVPGGKEICKKQLFFLVDKIEKVEVDDSNIESFLPDIYRKLEWLDREELIKKFVSVEFNRFLDYYKNTSDLDNPTEERKERRNKNSTYDFSRFFINLGKTDQLRPTSIIGMINDFTGKKNIEIGEISIQRNFSFFDADSSYENLILESFKGKEFKDREIVVEIASNERREGRSGRKSRSEKSFTDDRRDRKRKWDKPNRSGRGEKYFQKHERNSKDGRRESKRKRF